MLVVTVFATFAFASKSLTRFSTADSGILRLVMFSPHLLLNYFKRIIRYFERFCKFFIDVMHFDSGTSRKIQELRPRKTFSCSGVYRLPNIRDAYSLASFSLLNTLARPRFGRMIHIVPRQKPRFNSTLVIGKRMSSSTSLPGISSVSHMSHTPFSV